MIIILAISLLTGLDNFYINGLNEASYVYKAADDSLNHFFKDKFSFNLFYGDFSFGMKFIAELPEYDTFRKIEILDNNDLAYRWAERYLSYQKNCFFILGGTFEESFGSGLTFRAYEDDDFNIDTRLEGLQFNITKNTWKIKALYGSYKSDIIGKEEKNNLAYGIDLEVKPWKILSLGTSAIGLRNIHQTDNLYNEIITYSGRLNLSIDPVEFAAEAAVLRENDDKREFENIPAQEGYGIYANLITYLGKFTASAGFKKYDDFFSNMHDLPAVNYSGEPLTENPTNPIGFDEEGLQGEIRYLPNFENEIIVNYGESWNSSKDFRLSDLHASARHDFENFSITAEFSHLETIDDIAEKWEKKAMPVVSFDFRIGQIPVYTKAEWEWIESQHFQEESSYHEPLLQTDIEIADIGISVIAESRYNSDDGISKAEVWLGTEISTDIFSHTQLKVFAGKEKGGKICRNGTCRYQSAFEGLRVEITTSF